MLFHFDESERDLAAAGPTDLAAVTVELLRARRLGHHLIVISRRTARWLRDHLDLTGRDRAMLERVEQEFAQTGALHNLAGVFIRLSLNSAHHLRVNGNAIMVSVDQLRHCRLLDQSILVIEDLESDGRLYEFLLHNHCILHGCRQISYDLRHGGGTSFPKIFAHEINERRIVCGIVDSDRNSPLSGNTKLAALISARDALSWPFGFASSPPCREAENIVPFSLIMTLPSGQGNASNSKLLQINQAEVSARQAIETYFWLFFDFKEGVKTEKFKKLNETDRAWIELKLRLARIDPYSQELLGYGDKIVSQLWNENRFLSELRRLTHHDLWRRVFALFIDEILWPFAASAKIIT